MLLYELARKANHQLKVARKRSMGRYICPVRRIEFVSPPKQRVCAMTFDDGPSALAPNPDVSGGVELTKHLGQTLLKHGFGSTFDIVGDTGENYPDKAGAEGGFYWGGESYDHYPDFGKDALGGAKNQPQLVKWLSDNGFELSNHSYRHLIFGKSNVYNKRVPLESFGEVVDDLRRLHTLVEDISGQSMSLSRPPHYIDNIAGGFTAYDAYEVMGYNYMAASFDGMGWMPQKGSYEADAAAMAGVLKTALEKNPDALSGQIIFQKDGCNMSRTTPVATALEMQLDLLEKYGYRVVSVSQLLEMSPFEDLAAGDIGFEAGKILANKGFAIGFKNNTFRGEETLTFGQLAMAVCPRDRLQSRIEKRLLGARKLDGFMLSHPYCAALAWAKELGFTLKSDQGMDGDDAKAFLRAAGYMPAGNFSGKLTRGMGAELIASALL